MAAPTICVIDGCEKRVLARGWCPAHYDRWRKYGDPLLLSQRPKRAPLEWLVARADFDGDDCLVWPFGKIGAGYGAVYLEGGQQVRAHRLMCELVNGPPPAGRIHAAHSCGNGHLGCVHPKHLRWATPKENGEDRVAHGTVPRGRKHGNTKLRDDEALAIYRLKGAATSREVGRSFGVTGGAVNGIWHGQTWAWLTGEPPPKWPKRPRVRTKEAR